MKYFRDLNLIGYNPYYINEFNIGTKHLYYSNSLFFKLIMDYYTQLEDYFEIIEIGYDYFIFNNNLEVQELSKIQRDSLFIKTKKFFNLEYDLNIYRFSRILDSNTNKDKISKVDLLFEILEKDFILKLQRNKINLEEYRSVLTENNFKVLKTYIQTDI